MSHFRKTGNDIADVVHFSYFYSTCCARSMFILVPSLSVDALNLVPSVVVVLLFYAHGKHLRSCRNGQLTYPHFAWAGLDLLSG